MSKAVDQLQAWFEEGRLLRPDASERNTVDLSRALAAVCGAPDLEGPGADQVRGWIGEAEHLVFVLVDGLGMNLIEAMPEESFLARHAAHELRAVFPSATAAALTALATGRWPAQHAVTGWWTYLPDHELTAVALPFVRRFGGQDLGELGLTPSAIYPCESLLPSYQRDVLTLQPAFIASSVYSLYYRGETKGAGYLSLTTAVDVVLQRVASASEPTFTYLYIPSVDHLCHDHGPDHPKVKEHLAEIDEELGRLAEGLSGRARLALSADHGLIEVQEEGKHLILEGDELARMLVVPPSGEPRVPLFHVVPGQLARFQGAFEERFGERFALLTIDEATQFRLYGPEPPSELTRARLGDFVGIAGDAEVILYREEGKPTGTELLRGYHGGLAPAELRIPLVLA